MDTSEILFIKTPINIETKIEDPSKGLSLFTFVKSKYTLFKIIIKNLIIIKVLQKVVCLYNTHSQF